MQSAEKPATPPKNKNPWKTAAFASNYQSNTEGGGVPKTLFDVIQQAKSQSMENSSAPKTIFDVIQQAKAAKTNPTVDKTSLKTSAIIENVQTDHSPKQSSKSLWKTGLKKASLAEQMNESPHKASKIHWKENLEESSQEQSIDGEVFISAHPENISPKARWKKALNMIAVEKWKVKLEEIERLATAKLLHQLEIAESLPRKTTLVVSVIA